MIEPDITLSWDFKYFLSAGNEFHRFKFYAEGNHDWRISGKDYRVISFHLDYDAKRERPSIVTIGFREL